MIDDQMLDRIADRLSGWLRPGLDARYVARAVLNEMREPTFEMWDHAENESMFADDAPDGAAGDPYREASFEWPTARIFHLVVGWRAMIDAALGEQARSAVLRLPEHEGAARDP